MTGLWRKIILLGAVGILMAAAYPDIRERRQAEEGEPADGEGAEAEAEDPLGLPANASALLPGGGPPKDTFSCAGRGYGYFADPDNACQVFHVCVPVQLPQSPPGAPPTDMRFSFVCPAQTVFNQESFTCTRPEDAIPCDESPQYYHLNDALGRTDEPPSDASAEAVAGNQL